MKTLKLFIKFIVSFLLFVHYTIGQDTLVLFDKKHPTAKVIYEEGFKPQNSKKIYYPVVGDYSPTSYSNGPLGIEPNSGFCNYIYLPTDSQLQPGKQYTLKLSIKFDEAYEQMSFYQDNFGIALTSYLYPNKFPSYWGLWKHTHESLGVFEAGKLVTIEQEFRPLCTSKYIILGVFKAKMMDHLSCFMCKYPFELFSLSVIESTNSEKSCTYFGDAFKQSLQSDYNKREYNVYFDSESSNISDIYGVMLDSIANKIKKTQDVILLSAYTDISGNDNVRLGASRNKAIHLALVKRGINNSRITYYNLADSEASNVIISTDRRVEISLVKGYLFREQYSKALEAAKEGDFGSAHKIIMNKWINTVPFKKALAAIFDCWGESEKADIFKEQLTKAIKSKFYRKEKLRYRLDSLRYEWLKGRTLAGHLLLLKRPGTKHECLFTTSNQRDAILRKEVDDIYAANGFLTNEEVGRIANQIMPEIILTSNELKYLEKYLPLIKEACENRKLNWENYARLYDKISIQKIGFQRYGTRMVRGSKGQLVPEFPFENKKIVDEYRKQVKLVPFSKPFKEELNQSQKNLDLELVTLLNDIYKADQHHRNKIDERYRHFEKWYSTDSINQIKVKKILDERGWLGSDIIGKRGNTTLFLVIQHSNLATQLKYLPMMREAVRKGNAEGRDLALLEDRVALAQGKKQIYGSQIIKDPKTGIHKVAPIKNPEKVNEKRKEVGLEPIEDYVRRWNISWNLVQFKKE